MSVFELADKFEKQYETDFHAWCLDQSELLLKTKPEHIDYKNLAEELESMGRNERKELKNRLKILFCHLLKVKYQPEMKSASWTATINEQRDAINEHIEDNPSLKYCLDEISQQAYVKAIQLAEKEMGKPLPSEATCLNKIMTVYEALTNQWLP